MDLRERIEKVIWQRTKVSPQRPIADAVLACIDGPVVKIPEIYIGYARVMSKEDLQPAPTGYEYRLALVKVREG